MRASKETGLNRTGGMLMSRKTRDKARKRVMAIGGGTIAVLGTGLFALLRRTRNGTGSATAEKGERGPEPAAT